MNDDPHGAFRLAQWVAEHRVGGNGCGQPSAPWDGAPPNNRQQAYLAAVLRRQANKVAAAGVGERNNTLFEAALNCGSFVSGGGLDEQQVIEALEAAAEECGLTAEEGSTATAATIRSGLDRGMANPRAVPDREGHNVVQMFSEASPDGEAEADGPPPAGDEFWSQRTVFKHILAFARSRGAAPYAVLSSELRRAICQVAPHVMLPAIVGDETSVNFFTVAVGRSGQGKDIANRVGRKAIEFIDSEGKRLEDPDSPGIGSGEGLARLFKGYGNGEGARTTVHLEVNEVGTLEALADRRGQTLIYELIKAYMGQQLGFSNAQRATTTFVAENTYRLCLSVGAQPKNAQFFLHREKDGFPQRFLWVPTIDPDAPRPSKGPVEPVEPMRVAIPTFPTLGSLSRLIRVPDSVGYEIREFRWLVNIGSKDVDPLDGHLMLTRLKVAFGLALLESRRDISEDDWRIAGQLIEVSNQVRASVQVVVEESRRQENTARAHAQADREEVIAERLTEYREQRVWKAVVRRLKRTKRASRPDLYRACHSSIRGDLDPVLSLLLEEGVIVSCGDGDEYELGPE
jgi:hypothetical protein